MSSITSSFSIGLQEKFGPEGTNSPGKTSGGSSRSVVNAAPDSPGSMTDSMQLSQLAGLLSGLRLLEQSDPAAYKAILSELGASLSYQGQDASSAGNSAATSLLAGLAGDFTDEANSGAVPSRVVASPHK